MGRKSAPGHQNFSSFQPLDIRQQKAQLQTILKAAHVYKEGKMELEFRE
jgi:hypothetical protein